MLAARTLGAEGVDLELVLGDLADVRVVLDLGQHLDQRERRVAPLLRVVGRDAHKSMDAALGAQVAVGPAALDADGDALEARLLALELVDDLGPSSGAAVAQRRYMRSSISAQSVASVPPAPAVMVRIASWLVVVAREHERGAQPVVLGLEARELGVKAVGHRRVA